MAFELRSSPPPARARPSRELGGLGVTGSNQSVDDLATAGRSDDGRWGRIDVLVNSAGHGPRAPVLELTDEDWHRGSMSICST